jgi:DNA-binding CsgD family transcriptional regulator
MIHRRNAPFCLSQAIATAGRLGNGETAARDNFHPGGDWLRLNENATEETGMLGGSRDSFGASPGLGIDAAMDGFEQAVLHVGRPAFPDALMAHLRRVAAVDHCMVFAFANDRDAQCLLTAGDIAIGDDLGSAYAGHFHASDPNKEVIFERTCDAGAVLMPFVARRMYRRDYRKLFFDDSGIVDKFATALWHEGVCIYANFYRLEASGRYTERQAAALNRAGPRIVAAITRHCQLALESQSRARPDRAGLLADAFATPPLDALTSRERDVCMSILQGLSSEAIAGQFGISLNSVLTYRRRAYQRLGITSQNELFSLVMTQLATDRRNAIRAISSAKALN